MLKKISFLVLFCCVGYLVFLAGNLVMSGSPLLALIPVAMVLTLLFVFVKKAHIIEEK